MEMQVVHGLPGIRSVIRRDPVAGFQQAFLPRNLNGKRERIRNDVRVLWNRVLQRRQVHAGYHQHVRRGLRREIPKCDVVLALGDERSSQFTARDATENAILSHGQAL
jgi:hypothetical protein